ncbi:alpha-hydroxy-acid oxidizing protein [Burkholderia cenocepacia]|uniref:alpha-hydroxy acid oxidase n=1 Tax=Burkholderia cenocepacia TaxID=95486 RepID=UPI002857F46F|nr:alpha-hydroxy acid oxidase [Burkholderia cenocepacia]MDR8105031.1 alpha-hydroxy-acid oxidizing protein [Burkholderia cenocepacia]
MKRRLYLGRDLARVQTIEELRQMAMRRLPAFAWQYIESGAEDEHTLARNRSAFRDYTFGARTLIDTSERDTTIKLFGEVLPMPLAIAPTGFNGLAFPGGDGALARAAAHTGVPFTLSSFANESIEAIADTAGGKLWFQLYVLDNLRLTEQLVHRARKAGYRALLVTTDANVASSREWQKRCYRSPGRLTLQHQLDALLHPRWTYHFALAVMSRGMPIFANLATFYPPSQLSATRAAPLITAQLKPRITWEDIRKLRRLWDAPLLIKGVLSADDAVRAHELGVDGVVLSNHGGRQLDDAISPLEILSATRSRLPDFPLLIDSGFRRGNDILKAIALGATAVMVGRSTLYGLAAAGEAGATRALHILSSEIDRTLGLMGCTHLGSVSELMRTDRAEPCAPLCREKQYFSVG